MTKQFAIGGAVALLLIAGGAKAAVVESNAQGFAVEEKAHIDAPPAKVYATLIHPEHWWNPQHTFSQNAKNLSLDPKAGGCLCETLPGGGSVQHLTVATAMPGRMLLLRGAMGPFQSQGVEGALIFTLNPAGDGTDLVLNNNIGGFVKGGMGNWPEAADGMLTDLVAHLKYYTENGKPMPASPPAK
ncbi:MAG: ATPase [Proteobacteria bacterium]|nr:ATPase [Pseudomonadota bacterium]